MHPTEHAELVQSHVLAGLIAFFPPEKRKPKICEAVSPATFELIRYKASIHKAVCFTGRTVSHSCLQFVFTTWLSVVVAAARPIARKQAGVRRYSLIRGFVSKWLAIQWAYNSFLLCGLRSTIRAQVLAQKVEFVQRAAEDLQHAALQSNSGAMYQMLRRFTVPRVPRGQRLHDALGNPVQTLVEEQALFRDHFIGLAAGRAVPFADLVAEGRPGRVAADGIAEDLSIIPSRPRLTTDIATAQLGKAIGESKIGAEGMRLCPAAAAGLLHPLVTKSLINAEAPLQWKGAQLATLFKGKGARSSLKSYRDVALGDPESKTYGKVLRRFLLRAIDRLNPELQFGSGLGGGGCDLPHLAARAAMQVAEVRSECGALLFLDVTTAFASMVRECVLPTSAGKSSWARFLIDKGYPAEFAYEVMSVVEKVCDWESAGLSGHALAVLQDFHTCTWFSLEALDHVCASVRGCTAGNPIADLVYIASDVFVSLRLKEKLLERGLSFSVSDSAARSFFGLEGEGGGQTITRVAYVDDAVIPIVAPAPLIVARLVTTASVAKLVYENHGLELNFGAGKSEAVMSFHGPGAQQARRQVFTELGGILDCDGFGASTFPLRVVGKYRHLGGIITGSGDLFPEIGSKMAMVRQTARQLRPHFLRHASIPLYRKGQVVQALILARGLRLGVCLASASSQRCLCS